MATRKYATVTDLEDLRADIGVTVAKARDEWRDDLNLILEAHTSKITTRTVLALAVFAGLLKFDLPTELTAGAITLAVGKGAWGVIASRFSSN